MVEIGLRGAEIVAETAGGAGDLEAVVVAAGDGVEGLVVEAVVVGTVAEVVGEADTRTFATDLHGFARIKLKSIGKKAAAIQSRLLLGKNFP